MDQARLTFGEGAVGGGEMRGWWTGVAALLGLLLTLEVQGAPKRRLWTEAKTKRLHAEHSELVRVARRAMPSVVSITTEQISSNSTDPAQRGLGAGFVIHPDGYILTASHVIENSSEIRATLVDQQGNPREYVAHVVGSDEQTDFAILKVDVGHKLPVLALGSARQVEVADWIVAIGNPFGLGHSVTVGVVSYKGRSDVTPNGRSGYFDYLQTDASINPGNSGGPVLDLNGEVVAIANAVNVAGQGIGFAIPIDIAKAVIPHLMTRGALRRGWMGISVQDLSPELAESFGLRSSRGVVVSDVVEGGPASTAGLRVGDIITGVEGEQVFKAQALRWQVATAGVGKTLALLVRRDGKPMRVKVRLEDLPGNSASVPASAQTESPEGELEGVVVEAPAHGEIGAALDEVDKGASLRAGFTVPFGALVREVDPAGVSAQAGLSSGDVVLEVNAREVASREECLKSLQNIRSGETVRLLVRRGTKTLYLAFRKP